jgi:hypothetical protein
VEKLTVPVAPLVTVATRVTAKLADDCVADNDTVVGVRLQLTAFANAFALPVAIAVAAAAAFAFACAWASLVARFAASVFAALCV